MATGGVIPVDIRGILSRIQEWAENYHARFYVGGSLQTRCVQSHEVSILQRCPRDSGVHLLINMVREVMPGWRQRDFDNVDTVRLWMVRALQQHRGDPAWSVQLGGQGGGLQSPPADVVSGVGGNQDDAKNRNPPIQKY